MIIKKLMECYKSYKKELFFDLLCSVCKSISVALIPFFIKYLINDVIYSGCISYKLYCSVFLGIVFLFIIISYCGKYLKYNGAMVSEKMESSLRLKLFKHFLSLDFSFFDENKLGTIMSYITTDTYRLSMLLITLPEILIDFIIKIIGSGIVLFCINPVFAVILMSLVGIVLISAIYFVFKIKEKTENSRILYSRLISDAEESLYGVRMVQSFANESAEILKFEKNSAMYLNSVDEKNYFHGKMQAIVDPLLRGIIPVITLLSIYFISNNMLSVSDLIVFMLYADIFISPIFNLFMFIPEFSESVVGIKRVFEILSIESKIKNFDGKTVNCLKLNDSIEFKNVSFCYDFPQKYVFDKLNLKISAGETVAIVGESGVGKTTLCNLISRFYDVRNGEILFDGIPIKNIRLKNLRNGVSIVQQDIFLFSDTVMENIRYGRLDATDEEVLEAAKNAYADEFILKLKNGYQTQIGERGTKLSGGQKQRLAIARAFLSNAPILIFDEATSNLDVESERIIQKSMEMLLNKNRTTIVVAHRLATIQNVDRVIVLENGKIQEEGPPKLLLNNGEIYKKLYNYNLQGLINV